MSEPPRRISAGRGWSWVVAAARMIRQWPGVFLPMGLIVAAIQLVPILGGLAMLIIGPALVAGSVTAAHTATTGGTPTVRQLFAMFRQPERRREALKLCVPTVSAVIVAILILAIAMSHVMASQHINLEAYQSQPEKLVALIRTQMHSPAMQTWRGVAVAIMLFAYVVTVPAISRVACTREPAFLAIRTGFRDIWNHLGAWIVVAMVLFVGATVVSFVLMLTGMLFMAALGLLTYVYTLLGPLLYLAWRDLHGTPSTAGGQAQPPSGTLEA